MSDGPTREEQMFARLAELDLAAAEKAHAKLMAAEETSEIAELGRTYQRMARSLRQTLALKAKLAREREVAEAARPKRPESTFIHEGLRPLGANTRAHIDAAVKAAARHVERERPDYDELDETEIYDVLIDLAQDRGDDLLDMPLKALVAHVLEILEIEPLDAEPEGRSGDEPTLQDSA